MKELTKIDTPEEFVRWATYAPKNAKVAYYRGYLFRDKLTNHPSRTSGANAAPQFKTATKAWEFHRLGVVYLFQNRVDDEDYIYIAVKA